MKVFVTGASGFIGGHVVPLLLKEGHQVTGLCTTQEKAESLKKLGVTPVIGDLKDLPLFEREAAAADAVIHLAFIHDFTKYQESLAIEMEVVKAYAKALKGTGKPCLITSGTLAMGFCQPGQTLDDSVDVATSQVIARGLVDKLAHSLSNETKFIIMRLPPFVYGNNGHGFASMAIGAAKRDGSAFFIGDGSAKTSSVHVEDCARAYILALTKGQAGATYHVVNNNWPSFKEFAEAIGKLVGVPTKALTVEEAKPKLGEVLTMVFSGNHVATGTRIEKDLGWKPSGTKPSILEDISNGSYRC